jgi:hypothetical protein
MEEVVNEAVQRKEELAWSEKLNQKPVCICKHINI